MAVRVLAGVLLCLGTQSALIAQSTLTLIRDTGDVIACAVSAPAKSTRPADDLLTIEVRVPGAPGPLLLARLPQRSRDYSKLPIEVFLVPAPAKGAVPVSVRQRDPVESQLVPRVSTFLAGSAGEVVEVKYGRAALVGGVDVVAQRTAAADSGERIVSQTRCRIRAVDAQGWR